MNVVNSISTKKHILCVFTFQHADMHGVIGSLWHTQHDLQPIFNFTFALFTAGQQLLQSNALYCTEQDHHTYTKAVLILQSTVP